MKSAYNVDQTDAVFMKKWLQGFFLWNIEFLVNYEVSSKGEKADCNQSNHWQSCIYSLIKHDCHFAEWCKQQVTSEKAEVHYLIVKIAKAIIGNHWQSLTIIDNHWQSWLSKNLFFVWPSQPMIAMLFSDENQMYFQKILELVIG